jgi:hypothetical protein
MKITAKLFAVLALAGIAVTTVSVRAQDEKGSPPFNKAPGTMGVVQVMSYNLGMLRRVGGATHAVNGVFFIANGTMSEVGKDKSFTEYKVPKATVEMTYYKFKQGVVESPGSRWDFSLVDSSGKMVRKIFAAAGKYAWDEDTPGGKATPVADAAAYRLTLNSLSPQGLIWQVLTPDGKGLAAGVKQDDEGGKIVLTIPVNGVPAKVTLGTLNRPEKVETRVKHPVLGDTPIELDYSDYRDIEGSYQIFFPGHIVEKLGGHTVLDITVTEFHTNAYSVFPVPANVSQEAK